MVYGKCVMKYRSLTEYTFAIGLLGFLLADVSAPVQATEVRGSIETNTTWGLAGSPYNLAAPGKVGYGATLVIEAGVVVVGNGYPLEIFGSLHADGNASAMVTFTNLHVLPGTNTFAQPFSIVVRGTHLVGGSFHAPSAGASYGTLTLEDCLVENIGSYISLRYPTGDCSIKRNLFLGNFPSDASVLVTYTSGTNQILIQDNTFCQEGSAVESRIAANPSGTIVTGNNFLRPNFPTLKLPTGYAAANLVATNNYWGTLDTNVISQMIFDRNDATNSAGYLTYLPLLSIPNPAAPQVPLPQIQAQPQDQSSFIGGKVSFSIKATGLALTYQWQLAGTNLPGKTAPSLVISNVAPVHAGGYSIAVGDCALRFTTSSVAMLTVKALLKVAATAGGSVTSNPALPFYTPGSLVTLTAIAGRWYAFTNWADGETNSSRVITIGATNSYKAIFAPSVPLDTVTVGGVTRAAPIGMPAVAVQGTLTTSESVGFRGAQAEVSLYTTFSQGWVFYSLDGSDPALTGLVYSGPFPVDQTSQLRTLAYSSDFSKSVPGDPVMIFILPTLTGWTEGGGHVTLDPPHGVYHSNSQALVSAIADPGWTFLHWLGDASGTNPTTSVTMTRNKSVQAIFGTTFSTDVIGSGEVRCSPLRPSYPYGAQVRLTAVPTSGNYFLVWADAINGQSNNPVTFAITSTNPTVTAVFAGLGTTQMNTLTVIPEGRGQVIMSPPWNRFPTSVNVVLRPQPETGQEFLGWSGAATGSENPLVVTVNSNQVITANFTWRPSLNGAGNPEVWNHDGFRLALSGELGVYEILGSSNLTDWFSVGTVTNTFGTIEFTDGESLTNAFRFYRARQFLYPE
jgi:hypothetical protein